MEEIKNAMVEVNTETQEYTAEREDHSICQIYGSKGDRTAYRIFQADAARRF